MTPLAVLAEDGVHFWWIHECKATSATASANDYAVTPVPYITRTYMPHSGGTWRVVQQEPLTVEPSIHCLACGTHGFIRDGKWVPA